MMNNWILGDLDDMIFADCDWQPSKRGYFFCKSAATRFIFFACGP